MFDKPNISGSRAKNSRDLLKARDERRHGLHATKPVGRRTDVWHRVDECAFQKLHWNTRWQVSEVNGFAQSLNLFIRLFLHLNSSPSFSNFENSTRNLDMQELDYNPSRKDLTDARIHHLLAEELKPYRRVSWHLGLFMNSECFSLRELWAKVLHWMTPLRSFFTFTMANFFRVNWKKIFCSESYANACFDTLRS